MFVTRWLKVTETVLVAAASAVVLVVLIYSVPDCQPLRGFQQQATGSNKTGSRDVTSQRGNASTVADNGNNGEYIERSDPYGYNGHGFVIKVRCVQQRLVKDDNYRGIACNLVFYETSFSAESTDQNVQYSHV